MGDADKVRLGYHFTLVPDSIIDDERAGHKEIAVFTVIARHANKDGENSFPSLRTIESKAGLSRPTVIKTIETLVALGYLKKESRKKGRVHQSNLYTVLDPGVVKPVYQGGKVSLPPPSKASLPEEDSSFEEDTKKKSSSSPSLPEEEILNTLRERTGTAISLNGRTRKALETARGDGILTVQYLEHLAKKYQGHAGKIVCELEQGAASKMAKEYQVQTGSEDGWIDVGDRLELWRGGQAIGYDSGGRLIPYGSMKIVVGD